MFLLRLALICLLFSGSFLHAEGDHESPPTPPSHEGPPGPPSDDGRPASERCQYTNPREFIDSARADIQPRPNWRTLDAVAKLLAMQDATEPAEYRRLAGEIVTLVGRPFFQFFGTWSCLTQATPAEKLQEALRRLLPNGVNLPAKRAALIAATRTDLELVNMLASTPPPSELTAEDRASYVSRRDSVENQPLMSNLKKDKQNSNRAFKTLAIAREETDLPAVAKRLAEHFTSMTPPDRITYLTTLQAMNNGQPAQSEDRGMRFAYLAAKISSSNGQLPADVTTKPEDQEFITAYGAAHTTNLARVNDFHRVLNGPDQTARTQLSQTYQHAAEWALGHGDARVLGLLSPVGSDGHHTFRIGDGRIIPSATPLQVASGTVPQGGAVVRVHPSHLPNLHTHLSWETLRDQLSFSTVGTQPPPAAQLVFGATGNPAWSTTTP